MSTLVPNQFDCLILYIYIYFDENSILDLQPVSYTHLDVYKRQMQNCSSVLLKLRHICKLAVPLHFAARADRIEFYGKKNPFVIHF